MNKIHNINQKQESAKGNIQNKSIYSSQHDFFIETDYATYIESQDGTYHSYTFPIWRLEDNGLFENILFSLKPDGTYKTFIVSYDLTEQERDDLNNGLYVNIDGRFISTEINAEQLVDNVMSKQSAECTWSFTESCSYGNDNHPDGHEYSGAECPGYQMTYTQYCPPAAGSGPPADTDPAGPEDTGGTNPDGDPDNNCNNCGANGSNTGGSNTPGENSNVTYYTDNTSPAYQRGKYFKRNQLLDTQRAHFLALHLDDQQAIIDYLESTLTSDDIDGEFEGYSAEAVEFAIAAIEALEDGGEVDFEREIIIGNTVPDCVKSIITDLLNDNAYLDLGDMPDEVKQELNLSGYILDLFNNSENFQLTFKTENIPPNANGDILNAKTDRGPIYGSPGNFFINITIDSSYISNATDLAIARTIIHESVHAYILYTYQTEIFSDLSQAFMTLLTAAGMPEDDNPAQHQLMVDRFVNAMSNSLRNWDENSITDWNYYDYISWS
ncbi:hypothetical protein M0G43_07990 [Subsaxibacter sp. CAU 1640]|uniref:hypothetical protein n=1 Tax=Subsaxibacter sp. CAU 1640 TaxID=2933271 RepID=UPI0020054545|nr:hypothetical protein [Subsaxibacter sp. CAU 1640]MCK7590508.1 hypothetical protein [Subsaxibacter sp. CAU 1640]